VRRYIELYIIIYITEIVAGVIADARIDRFERHDLEAGLGCRAWLRRDHTAESGHCPASNMIILRTYRYQILFR